MSSTKLQIGVCTEILSKVFHPNYAKLLGHRETVRALAKTGADFLELAPAGFKPNIAEMDAATRRRLADEAAGAGVPYRTFHWLMSFTPHKITSDDPQVRAAAAKFLRQLAAAADDMGIMRMVFGSPPSRSVEGEVSEQHFAWAAEVFQQAMPAFEDANCKLDFEFLAAKETNFVNSPADAIRLAEMVNHPKFRVHFDIKAASPLVDGIEGVCSLLEQHAEWVDYLHFNDAAGRRPGYGAKKNQPGSGELTEFLPVFRTINRLGRDWDASVEIFDFLDWHPNFPCEDPLGELTQAISYLRACEAAA